MNRNYSEKEEKIARFAKAMGHPARMEFRRVRDEIKNAFARFYITEIRKLELPKCFCGGKC